MTPYGNIMHVQYNSENKLEHNIVVFENISQNDVL